MAPARQYKSPPHVLVRSFRLSRERWKRKYQSTRDELKRLSNRVRDLEKSRQAWADKAAAAQAQLAALACRPAAPGTDPAPAPKKT